MIREGKKKDSKYIIIRFKYTSPIPLGFTIHLSRIKSLDAIQKNMPHYGILTQKYSKMPETISFSNQSMNNRIFVPHTH